jgi:hypothetical protein
MDGWKDLTVADPGRGLGGLNTPFLVGVASDNSNDTLGEKGTFNTSNVLY